MRGALLLQIALTQRVRLWRSMFLLVVIQMSLSIGQPILEAQRLVLRLKVSPWPIFIWIHGRDALVVHLAHRGNSHAQEAH